MISPEATAVNKIAPTRKAAIPTKVDPSKVAIAHFVIPTSERSETGGTRCPPAANHPRVPHPCCVQRVEFSTAPSGRAKSKGRGFLTFRRPQKDGPTPNVVESVTIVDDSSAR